MTPRHRNILRLVGVLVAVLLASWFLFPRKASSEPFFGGYTEPIPILARKMGYGVICYTIDADETWGAAISCVKAY